mgnify:CR=1 FL=1
MTDQTRAVRGVRRPRLRRAGAITLELIIMLPVWLIMLGAIVQFGLLIGNRQQVALASRVGAEEASRTNLPSGGGVPLNVVHVVEQQLQSSGIDQCKITLEHNVVPPAPAVPVVLSSGDWLPHDAAGNAVASPGRICPRDGVRAGNPACTECPEDLWA